MVINNTATQVNDVLIIQVKSPILGITSLQTYSDVTVGETVNRFFKREFSYSLDGLFFTDWLDLKDEVLQGINFSQDSKFYVNYRYTRLGSDDTGVLEWHSVRLIGDYNYSYTGSYFVLPKSIFSDYFYRNPKHIHLCTILLKKLYDDGILAEYITRGETENPEIDDRDFIDFWDTVCCFYALIFLHAEKVIEYYDDKESLKKFLSGFDMYFNQDQDMQDLKYVESNYYEQISLRGTVIPFDLNNDEKVLGEFLRLIHYKVGDFYLFEKIPNTESGWWMNKTSPAYKGNFSSKTTIVAGEFSNNLKNSTFNNTPIYNANGDVLYSTDSSYNVYEIKNVTSGDICGIGYDKGNWFNTNFQDSWNVDENVDYELSFYVKKIGLNPVMNIGCVGVSVGGNKKVLLNQSNGLQSEYFIKNLTLNNQTDYFFIKLFIYGKNNLNTNIGTDFLFGNQLRMVSGVDKIVPIIEIDGTTYGTSNQELKIRDLRLRTLSRGITVNKIYDDGSMTPSLSNKPLTGGTNFCFTLSPNIINIRYKNNTGKISKEQIYSIVKKKLLPFNNTLNIIEI